MEAGRRKCSHSSWNGTVDEYEEIYSALECAHQVILTGSVIRDAILYQFRKFSVFSFACFCDLKIKKKIVYKKKRFLSHRR